MGVGRVHFLAAAFLMAGAVAISGGPASAAAGSLLFGKPGTRNLGEGVFEVTARGNNGSERRSSYEMAVIKAAKRARKENSPYFAVLREKSGTWTMGGRPIGGETTLRFRLRPNADALNDNQGRPARVYEVAQVLVGER